jgi:hypothetical protein
VSSARFTTAASLTRLAAVFPSPVSRFGVTNISDNYPF